MNTASPAVQRTSSPSAYHKARNALAIELEASETVLTAYSNHPLVVERNGLNGKERGFILRLHQDNPDAPLSPFYLQFRTPDNPKPGPLTQDIIDQSASCMQMLIAINGLHFDAVAGVPRAGDPFAEALARFTGKPSIPMEKYEHNGKRHIASLKGKVPLSVKKVLLVDDLITRSDSKREAIQILRDEGMKVVDVIVVVDREQGGRDGLAALNCELHSVFTITEMFGFFLEIGKIDSRLNDDTQRYLASQV